MQLNQNKLPILKVCHTLLIQWNGITSKLVIRCWINQNGMTCFCFAEEFNPGLIRPVRHTFQLSLVQLKQQSDMLSWSSGQAYSAEATSTLAEWCCCFTETKRGSTLGWVLGKANTMRLAGFILLAVWAEEAALTTCTNTSAVFSLFSQQRAKGPVGCGNCVLDFHCEIRVFARIGAS